jgi:hypothetical protein
MNKIPDINKVIDTPFFTELHQLELKLSENFTDRSDYKSGMNNHHLLSEDEKRTTRIFRLASDMSTILKDLSLCYLLINKSIDKVYLERHEISELDYIRYHFEVFIHKVHTISEIMKLLCNETLDLGLSPKNCNWANLISFQKFKTSKSKIILEKNFTDFKHLIDDRHLNTHRGIFEDKEIDRFSPEYFIYQFAKRNKVELEENFQKALTPALMKYRIKQIKKSKIAELQKYEQKLFENVNTFLKSLKLAQNSS